MTKQSTDQRIRNIENRLTALEAAIADLIQWNLDQQAAIPDKPTYKGCEINYSPSFDEEPPCVGNPPAHKFDLDI